ncbi:MAG: 4Fe-4S dicluster domain-containing protein [Solirubrobacterales bacterium]|nr:4Fe-4S dicluster domain-containing protein [Solirubrobacterales bacterium]
MSSSTASVIRRAALDDLIAALDRRGYTVVGPTVRDKAIVYEKISSMADLPEGVTDEQEGGTYRLHERDDGALFGFNNGPNSWKHNLFPPNLTLWKAKRAADGEISYQEQNENRPRYAFLGVRSCDLAAIGVQDKVFIGDSYTDADYEARRRDAFIVAVNCSKAGNTCFCVSMDTGPRADSGYDLALTELLEGDHRFLVEVGSERGQEVLSEIGAGEAEQRDEDAATAVSEKCASEMGRELDTDGIKELLYRNMEHPRWDEVSERCLTCGNCTLVCPTCFCHTVEDMSDLAGTEAERVRRWDSCFNLDHSHIHGGSVRNSPPSRYRQWMTHKLATWIDQFGTSGCVGCGRCITWCPVAIDITEETAAIRAADMGPSPGEERGISADH